VITGGTPPVLRVLLFRRVVGDVAVETPFPTLPPLLGDFPGPGDFGEEACWTGFSTVMVVGAGFAFAITGLAPAPDERRC
jgi:hypothetical protein